MTSLSESKSCTQQFTEFQSGHDTDWNSVAQCPLRTDKKITNIKIDRFKPAHTELRTFNYSPFEEKNCLKFALNFGTGNVITLYIIFHDHGWDTSHVTQITMCLRHQSCDTDYSVSIQNTNLLQNQTLPPLQRTISAWLHFRSTTHIHGKLFRIFKSRSILASLDS